ncbi:MAG: L-2-amino-thiazoline-4-carboxylic acid hydrolase [Candidatus Thorarchaeota archaeon]
MKFKKYGKPATEITEKFRPLDKAHEFIFRRLDSLLDYILVQNPSLYHRFIEKLYARFRALVGENGFETKLSDVQELVATYSTLKGEPELIRLHLCLFIRTLAISEQTFWDNNEARVGITNFIESAVIPEYNWILVLSHLLSKEEAIQISKGATDRYCVKYDTSTIEKYENLNEMRNAFIKFWDSGRLGRIRIASDVVDGVWIVRCENCEKVAALQNLDSYDRELLNAVECHSDFQVARLFNENFVLTRNMTIGAGDRYCDFVYHDIRFDKELKHPSRDYIDNLDSIS